MKHTERVKLARAAFVATPEHHNKKIDELMLIYGVGRNKISDFRRTVGIKTQFEEKKERDAQIRAHPKYGTPGEPAPCVARDIANDVGCHLTTVSNLRLKDGIEPYIRRRVNGSFVTDRDYKRCLSNEEKETYALCRLTRTWGRPRDMV